MRDLHDYMAHKQFSKVNSSHAEEFVLSNTCTAIYYAVYNYNAIMVSVPDIIYLYACTYNYTK